METRTIAGKYAVEEEIARGGMGVIYRAEHTTLKRTVAIKVLHPQYSRDPTFLRRFEHREARAMARLDHENIVQVFDVGEDQGFSYLVMEFFPGKDLKQRILEKGKFSMQETISIALQIAQALAYAHARGIVHRDIKPGNIIVDAHDRVKITDFGIAAAADEATLTSTGQVMGTPGYMSPEQARGEAVDARSDLYSTGIVIYHMLAGKTPFEGLSGVAIIGKLVGDEGELQLDFPENVPPELEEIVRILLKRNPEDRIQSAPRLVERLQQAKQKLEEETATIRSAESPLQETVDVRRPRATLRAPSSAAQKSIRRKALIVLLSGTTVLAIAFLGYLYWMWLRVPREAEQELHRAQERLEEAVQARQRADAAKAEERAPQEYEPASIEFAKGDEALQRGTGLIEQEEYGDAMEPLAEAQALLEESLEGFRQARNIAEERHRAQLKREAEQMLSMAQESLARVDRARKEADAVDVKQGAAEMFQPALTAFAKGDEALQSGRSLIEQGEYEGAMEVLAEAQTLLGQSLEGFRQARNIAEERKRAQLKREAEQMLSMAQESSAQAARARKEADAVDAKQRAPELYELAIFEAKQGDEILRRAKRLIPKGQFEESKSALQGAASLLGSAEEGFRRATGNAHLFRREYSLAIQNYDRALQLLASMGEQAPFELCINKGTAHFHLGNYETALIEYDKSIDLKPDDPNGYANRARTFRRLKNYKGAEKDYEKAIKLAPNNAEIHNDYAWHLIDATEEFDKGIIHARKALELRPGSASVMDTLGWGYFRKGDYENAVFFLTEASRAEPQNKEIEAHLKKAQEAFNASEN